MNETVFICISLIIIIIMYIICMFVADNRYHELRKIIKINSVFFYITMNIVAVCIPILAENIIKYNMLVITENTYWIIIILEIVSVFFTTFSIIKIIAYLNYRHSNDEANVEVDLAAAFSLILIGPIEALEIGLYYMIMTNYYFKAGDILKDIINIFGFFENMDRLSFSVLYFFLYCIMLEILDCYAYKNVDSINKKISINPIFWYIILNIISILFLVINLILKYFINIPQIICLLSALFSEMMTMISVLRPYSYVIKKYNCKPSEMKNYIKCHISIITLPIFIVEVICYRFCFKY